MFEQIKGYCWLGRHPTIVKKTIVAAAVKERLRPGSVCNMITAHPHMIHTRELITAATHTLLQKATSPVTPTGVGYWDGITMG